jgi:hypothetical protein
VEDFSGVDEGVEVWIVMTSLETVTVTLQSVVEGGASVILEMETKTDVSTDGTSELNGTLDTATLANAKSARMEVEAFILVVDWCCKRVNECNCSFKSSMAVEGRASECGWRNKKELQGESEYLFIAVGGRLLCGDRARYDSAKKATANAAGRSAA